MYTSFLAIPAFTTETPSPESALQLYSVPKPDREPVKILIIGSSLPSTPSSTACTITASLNPLSGPHFYPRIVRFRFRQGKRCDR